VLSIPDGVEVVASRPPAGVRAPLLVLDPLLAHLDERGIGTGPLSWTRVGDGQSNVTFRMRRGDVEFVLRRGPRPPLPPSTHDMVREATIQSLLAHEGVAVPRVIDVCEDAEVLGVPFYLMEWLDGCVLTDREPAQLADPAARSSTSLALVDTLVSLHAAPIDGRLAQVGRPEGYLERQVRRFADLWEVNATRELPEVGRLGSWLASNLPVSGAGAVVHGDYRLGNLMLAPEPGGGTLALLDWEMATLGDPLADLGYLVATYSDAGSPSTPLHLSTVTTSPGYLSGAELAVEYQLRTGRDLAALPWYEALALWKGAVFCEAIYKRWRQGERPDDHTFAPSLEAGVPQLLDAAAEAARRLS
jgi:aminoglycoside phosphotransferase (APT) family kinase protein